MSDKIGVRRPTIVVNPVHFDDYSGTEFERLVFAYHVRTKPDYSMEWYGQAGADKGRDIIGSGQTAATKGKTLLVACANWKDFTSAKAISDLEKCMKSPHGRPDTVRFVVADMTISQSIRDRIRARCDTASVATCEIWSGTEFEEHLRANAQSLLKRFLDGEVFPDAVAELVQFARQTPPSDDKEAMVMLRKAFDRPAFTDEIRLESSLGAFREAIEDTISVLNTGVWKTRNNIEIRRVPSKNEIKNPSVVKQLNVTLDALCQLRTAFDQGIRNKTVRPCPCGDPDCSTYLMKGNAADDLEHKRRKVLKSFDAAFELAFRAKD